MVQRKSNQILNTASCNQNNLILVIQVISLCKSATDPFSSKGSVPVLAGAELISFPVAGMGLHFAFVLSTGLIPQGCFCYC